MKTYSADNVFGKISSIGDFTGFIAASSLTQLLQLFKDHNIRLRPNNLGTQQMMLNVTFGTILGAGIGGAVAGSFPGALCGAAVGAGIAYWASSYSITITPTGQTDRGGESIWSLTIAAT